MNSNHDRMEGISEAVNLLNAFNEVVTHKQYTLDSVIQASALLLASALRQIGGDHGDQRVKQIVGLIPHLVDDSNAAMKVFFES